MKKIERRALLCLVLAGCLLGGLAVFLLLWAVRGGDWASSAFNRHLYNDQGILISGTVLDRNGQVLSTVDEEGERVYPGDKTRRKATLHVVGDLYGNISTGALNAFAPQLTGYNLLLGAFGAERGNDLYLTIDAEPPPTGSRISGTPWPTPVMWCSDSWRWNWAAGRWSDIRRRRG